MLEKAALKWLLLFSAIVLVAAEEEAQLKPVANRWLGNTRYTEYRGVKVTAAQAQIKGTHSGVDAALKACNARKDCKAVSSAGGNKYRLVKGLQMSPASKQTRFFHKSGHRTVTRTTRTRTIRVTKWRQFAGVGLWGTLSGYKFKVLYGPQRDLNSAFRACLKHKECNGVSRLSNNKWQMGKGRQVEKGTLTWVRGGRMGTRPPPKATRTTTRTTRTGSYVKNDGWHRGYFHVSPRG